MRKFSLASFLVVLTWLLLVGFSKSPTWTADTPLREVQTYLGEALPDHYLTPDQELIRKGEEIVKTGRTTDVQGNKTHYVSKYYVCTTCHNLEIEDPDLRVSDPEARLDFVRQKNLPFLQGTTFKGIVNRESW
ncbi:MAG: cytochrome c, partial [Phaeodactylibacter sp.]|nr:cytochrome c [Phaeodactylibacter sp.]